MTLRRSRDTGGEGGAATAAEQCKLAWWCVASWRVSVVRRVAQLGSVWYGCMTWRRSRDTDELVGANSSFFDLHGYWV
jgi:hypothetical protein